MGSIKNDAVTMWHEGYEEVARLLSILGFRRIDAAHDAPLVTMTVEPADIAAEADRLAEELHALGVKGTIVRGQYRQAEKDGEILLFGLSDERLGPIEYALVKMNKPGETRSSPCEVCSRRCTCPIPSRGIESAAGPCRSCGKHVDGNPPCAACDGAGVVQEELPDVESVGTALRYLPSQVHRVLERIRVEGREDDFDLVPVRPHAVASAA